MRRTRGLMHSASMALVLFACALCAEAQDALPKKLNTMPMGCKAAKTASIKVKYLDIPYAAKSPTQKLDLYLPNKGKGPFPLIIEIHPGGFMIGSKSEEISPMLEGLKRGYAVASINYRMSGEAQFPAAVNDVKAAIKFLRANSQKYHLKADRFATWGGSAGGNLSAMAATSGDVASLVDPELGNDGVSDAVQAAVDWFGIIHFSDVDAQFAALGISAITGPANSSDSFESKYLGRVVGTKEAQPLVEKASPMTYITAKTPPIYLQHGTQDCYVPITQSEEFAWKVAAAIGPDKVVFESIPGAGHGGPEFEDPANTAKIFKFLDKYLKK